MAKTVIGVFESENQAERAVDQMKATGFSKEEISIVAKDEKRKGNRDTENMRMETDDVADGTTTGGVLGGLAGLAAGAGALAVPGLGPIIAAGPIAGALSGIAAGGIAGGLIDWGIPEERGKHYEEQVKQGKILTAIKAEDQKVDNAADILRNNGARDVETH